MKAFTTKMGFHSDGGFLFDTHGRLQLPISSITIVQFVSISSQWFHHLIAI